MFYFDANDVSRFPHSSFARAEAAAGDANDRLEALRRAFPTHSDTDLQEHAYWNEAACPTISVAQYGLLFARKIAA